MEEEIRLLHLMSSRLHREWYESLAAYSPAPDLIAGVRALVPATWRAWRSEAQFHVAPPGEVLPSQGWKIHVSATPNSCRAALELAAPVCVEEGTPFKFLLDADLVRLSTSKGWTRPASGKFITVYPRDDAHFYRLLERLTTVLSGLEGPYVLTDRRYRDGSPVYYRFGGIRGDRSLSHRGEREYFITSPTGEKYPDWRLPYWRPPPWVNDPFPEKAASGNSSGEIRLRSGRYTVERALGFSVTGGVYLAKDGSTGRSVVVKEARPYTGWDTNGNYAPDRLKTEFRLLSLLADARIAPEPVELFAEWEHTFLVEEYLAGVHLGHFTIAHCPIVKNDLRPETLAAYIETVMYIWRRLARAVATMHEREIICGDLSLLNVIVADGDSQDVRLIDLEAAYQSGVDDASGLITPGFVNGESAGRSRDVFALGSMMLGSIFPMNGLLDLAPERTTAFANELADRVGLPAQARETMLQCLSLNAADRPSALDVVRALDASDQAVRQPSPKPLPTSGDLEVVLSGVVRYIQSSADTRRGDRLYPAVPAVFATNPLNVAYGACGVAYALMHLGATVPSSVRTWLLSRPMTPDQIPPGLYVGLSGIAWVFADLGLTDVAAQLMRAARSHPVLWDAPGIFDGASGYGLACLKLFRSTGYSEFLDAAIQVGDRLLRTRTDSNEGTSSWSSRDGETWLGYAYGASGAAVFLLYLNALTRDDRYLEVARRAIDFDLAFTRPVEGQDYMSLPRGVVGRFENVLSHYWLDGTAGVASAVLRLWSRTRDPHYALWIERLLPDVARPITAFPGLFRGMAGLGDVLLDAYQFTGQARYLLEAQQCARGLLLYAVDRPAGIAFPGEQLLRISTDLGTGSSGIALFLHRLARPTERPSRNFLLDECMDPPQQAQAESAALASLLGSPGAM